MANQPLTGLPRLVAAFRNSRAGLRDVWRSDEAIRMECVALGVSVPLALWIADSGFQAAVLIAAVLFVLLVEVLNCAIESVVDRIGPERHELSRIAKDLGSLAVLLAMVLAGIVWAGAIWDAVFA